MPGWPIGPKREPEPEPPSFWSQDCPERGPALTHAHWSNCDPRGVHPKDPTGNGGKQHASNQCCHCEMTSEQWHAERAKADIVIRETETADHLYVFTITGKCNRCQRTQDVHPTVVKAAPMERTEDGQVVCNVDHNSINAVTLLIVDGGLERRKCPACTVMVEPKMATGEPIGKADGIGRGWVSPRMRARWEAIAQRVASGKLVP